MFSWSPLLTRPMHGVKSRLQAAHGSFKANVREVPYGILSGVQKLLKPPLVTVRGKTLLEYCLALRVEL